MIRTRNRTNKICVGATLWLVVSTLAWSQQPPQPTTRSDSNKSIAEEQAPAKTANHVSNELSDAEKITRLQRSIDDDTQLLKELNEKLNAPDSEYALAEQEFLQIDQQVESKKKQLQESTTTQSETDLGSWKDELAALETKRKLVKDRFDLAIRERKVQQEQMATLEKKLQQDQLALKKLKGEVTPSPATQPESAATANPTSEATTSQPASPPSNPVPDPQTTSPQMTSDGATQLPGPLSTITKEIPSEKNSPTTLVIKPPPSPELEKARHEAANKQVQAQEAAQEAQTVTERMEAARKSIVLEQQLLQTARERLDNAEKTEQTFYDELQAKWREGASHAQLSDLRKKIGETRIRSSEAEQEIRERTDRIAKLQDELSTLQSERITALKEANQKSQEAQSAHDRVKQLENPLSPRNLLRWLVERGPHVATIIAGMFLLIWLSRLMEMRIVKLLAGRSAHGTSEDHENRVRTLVGVFRSAASVAIYTGGTLMVLTELGVNIVPLMGGAAVFGLAVAFGAQNLIRDYFYGFMILLENQYTINDVIKLGDVTGQVENITLRITVLRGLDGTVHFIPNGQIEKVSNMTHDWSRALFDVGISYNENVDQVMKVLIELGKELRRDPAFRGIILESPEMLGVNDLGDSAVVIRFLIKTKPLQQWKVKREMLRRIKLKFDELGIEIPFPHQTLYHRVEADSPLSNIMAGWTDVSRESRDI